MPREITLPSFARSRALLIAALLAGAGAAAEDRPAILLVATLAPAGEYRLDPAHARLSVAVSHLGFSNYTLFLTGLEATLAFDPADPEAMELKARVNPGSVRTLHPDPEVDFDSILAGPNFLDAARYPEITFESRSVRLVAPERAAVTGDLTLHGVTRRITLSVTFNGGYAGHPQDPGGARVGFSARGTIFRSDFGITFGLPAPGTTLGVGDEVAIRIEAGFINPDAPGPQLGP